MVPTQLLNRITGNDGARREGGEEARRGRERRRRPSAQDRLDRLSRSVLVGTFVAVIAVGFGIVSSVSSQIEVARVTGDLRPAVVAAQEIAAGATISSDMVAVVDVPASYLSAGAVADPAAYVGRTASVSIPANAQISPSMVASEENASSLAAKIAAGYVAATVDVSSDTGLSTLLKCGDTVEVYATQGNGDAVYQVASGVTVLALDGYLSGPAGGESYSTVTLQVEESQAEDIAVARASGEVSLVLNPLSASR